MALANYACWLVRRLAVPAQRVLMMDWDLEAPGLHRFFAKKAGLPENADRPGIINYFDQLRQKLESETGLYKMLVTDESGKTLHEKFPLEEYLIRDVEPGVDLIKAGNLDPGYAQLVSTFDWVEFYGKYGALLNVFTKWLESNYAYCLIDSRTGFNDISGICTMLMPEKLVAVFTPNYQNVYGVLDLAERAVNYRRASADFRPLTVFPLPSRIENSELEKKESWREKYQKEFQSKFLSIYQLENCDLSEYFDKIQLPHVGYYAYGEELALLREGRGDSLSLSGAYEQFFQRLTEQETPWDNIEEVETSEEKIPVVRPEARPAERVETEIYISYDHIDNRPLLDDQSGWVSTFHQALETRLAQILGKEVGIWYDVQLQGSDFINANLIDRIHQATIFVPILSPRYLKSDWCMTELKEFLSQAEAREGLMVGNMSRIFKVVKTPIQPEDQPSELRDLLGYQFYEFDEAGRPREFAQNLGPGRDFKFWNKIDDLAFDIKRLIETDGETSQEATAASVGIERPSVYLAETTSDLAILRDNIKRELMHFGYKVLPDKEPSRRADSLEVSVREQLARCSISVHLIGATYGLIPEGEKERSVIKIQEELAAQRASADPSFSCLIWMPPELLPQDTRQQAFIRDLQDNLGIGAELLQTPLEDLKTRILEKLSRTQPAEKLPSIGSDLTRVYLIYDNLDVEAITPLEEYLFDRGYEIISSLGVGEGAQAAQYHRENLLNCDAVLIYYGNGNQLWLRSQLWDLQKAKGWGRAKPMLATAVYIGQPSTPEKVRFKTREAYVINSLSQDPETALQPFIAQIEKPAT